MSDGTPPILRLLVLSDLRAAVGASWQPPIVEALCGHLLGLGAQGPAAIAVVGDATESGSEADFRVAARWLDALRTSAKLDHGRLLVVPGERDVDRDAALDGRPNVEDAILGGQEAIAKLLNGGAPSQLVMRRLLRWRSFAKGLGLPLASELPWWQLRISAEQGEVGVLGLCSAWASGTEPPRALVGLAQVNALLGTLHGCALRVALVHHPIDALNEVDRVVEAPLQGGVDLLIRGHGDSPHQALPRYAAPRPAYVEVAPGPLFSGFGAPSHAAMVEVYPDEVVVQPLIYTAAGWIADRTLTQNAEGHVRLGRRAPSRAPAPIIAPKAPPPPPSWPADPYPVLAAYEHPDTFGGRQQDLAALLRRLQDERLVWTLYAPSGAGKSSLLRAGLLPALRAQKTPVAFWDQPAVGGLAQHLLRQLLSEPPADDSPASLAAALAALRDQAGQRPVLVLDQLEEAFDSPAALGRLGDLIAASALAPGGRAARWVLVFRDDFLGRVRGWLADLRPYRAASALREQLPWDLSAPETRVEAPILLLGDGQGAPDRHAAAVAAFYDAIARPLQLSDPDGTPHYPYRMAEPDIARLAEAFARARAASPGDPLTPELQVVLDKLIGPRRATRDAPLTLQVPEEIAALDALIGDAIGEHLRRKLGEVCDQGDPAGAPDRRTTAMLLLMRLVDESGRRRPIPKAELLPGGDPQRERLIAALGRRGVWLLREEQRDGQWVVTLQHDRLAAEVFRIQGDPVEAQKYGVDTAILSLWAFVLQRTAAWRAGDPDAATLSFRRYQELDLAREKLPWDEATRAWWAAADAARLQVRRLWTRRALLLALLLVALLGGVGVKVDRTNLEAAVKGDARTGEPLRALSTLVRRYRYDGDELVAVLGTLGDGTGADKRDEIFGLGPVGLSEEERAEILPPLVILLAPAVEGSPNDESFYGALLAAADAVRPLDAASAAGARRAVVAAMRAARGSPPDIDVEDGSWSIPIAGNFPVGCFRELDAGCRPDEGETPHWVTLSPYRIRRFEESLGEYRRFDADHLSDTGRAAAWPLEEANWYEVTAYAAWIGARLPTEAQWEVAARGGCDASAPDCDAADYRRSAYFCGSNEADLVRVGFYAGTPRSELRRFISFHPLLAAESVPGADPHPLGLLNVHGNVYEWIADWYGTYPMAHITDPSGPSVPPNPEAPGRLIRGGSWSDAAVQARSASRAGTGPWQRNYNVGLRLVIPQPLDGGP